MRGRGPGWLGLLGAIPTYARLAWWGLLSPRLERRPLVVLQAVVLGDRGVLLAVRSDLRGWELPGGTLEPGEAPEEALRRELREETGLEVEIVRRVGDYVRTGFRPHTAKVYLCRACGGCLRTSSETRAVCWFEPRALPRTLFPWYRAPLADALVEEGDPVERHEHHGPAAVWAGLRTDFAMRRTGDRAR